MFLVRSPLVSIHAPVKGATVSTKIIGIIIGVSIHAPVKGATKQSERTSPYTYRFNSRSREGSDY